MKKQLVSAMLVLSMAASIVGCGKKDAEDVAEISTIKPEEEVEAVDESVAFWDQTSEDDRVRSYLTGDWVDAKYGRQRHHPHLPRWNRLHKSRAGATFLRRHHL